MTDTIQIMVTMICYMLAVIGIGFAFARRANKSTEDYFLGGRTLGPWVTAMSAEASDMSGWLLMGLPGVAYWCGVADAAWTAIGLAVGTYINWLITSKRLRRYSEKVRAITLPEFFSNRFHEGGKVIMTIAALFILIFFTVYASSCLVTCGKLFSTLFGFDYVPMMIVGALFVLLYTLIGGFLAESASDFMQAVVMIVALVVVVTVGCISAGGIDDVITNAKQIPGFLEFFGMATPVTDANGVQQVVNGVPQFGERAGYGVMTILSGLAWGLGYFGMPQVLVRFLSIRSSEEIKKSRIIATTWCVISLACGVCIGLVGRAMMPTQFATQAAAENIFIVVSQALLPSFMCGIVVSGIFAASMSSSSSYMIIGASAVGENIFRGLLHRKATDRQVMMVARITLLVMFIFGIVVAFDQNSSIFQVVSYAWAGLGASFGPLMLTSLYWRRTNKYGAIAGMLSGTATVLIWHNLVKPLGGIFAIYELLPAFIVSLLFIVVISLLTPAPSAEVLHEFDHYLDDPDDRHVDDDLVAAEIAAGEKRSQI